MRLIDADALMEKYNVKDVTMAECLTDTKMAKSFEKFCIISDAVEDAPTVDAVPVVRCRECKHWSSLGGPGLVGLGECRNKRFFAFEYGFETEDNFTCADGERKGGDE